MSSESPSTDWSIISSEYCLNNQSTGHGSSKNVMGALATHLIHHGHDYHERHPAPLAGTSARFVGRVGECSGADAAESGVTSAPELWVALREMEREIRATLTSQSEMHDKVARPWNGTAEMQWNAEESRALHILRTRRRKPASNLVYCPFSGRSMWHRKLRDPGADQVIQRYQDDCGGRSLSNGGFQERMVRSEIRSTRIKSDEKTSGSSSPVFGFKEHSQHLDDLSLIIEHRPGAHPRAGWVERFTYSSAGAQGKRASPFISLKISNCCPVRAKGAWVQRRENTKHIA
ncbi:hypothetical protein B0H34DRAFT_674785 [Crassisporium funariophilum]|nr:hypothetical protein B0H34DRAFT_674785 [Crassisporium funariophilum]